MPKQDTMMQTSLLVAVGGLTLIFSLSIPHLVSTSSVFALTTRKHRPISAIYEDEDGRARESAESPFSLYHRRLLASLSAIGLIIQLIWGIIHILNDHSSIALTTQCLLIGAWVRFAQTLERRAANIEVSYIRSRICHLGGAPAAYKIYLRYMECYGMLCGSCYNKLH